MGTDIILPTESLLAKYAESNAAFAWTEQGMSLRYANANAHRLRYVAEEREWIAFDGICWRRSCAATLAKVFFEDLIGALLKLGDELHSQGRTDERDKCSEQLRILSTAKAQGNILRLAEPKLAVSRAAFDRDALDLLCTPSGTVNLRTGEVAANDPARLLTQCTAVAYNPAAPAPTRFIEVVRALAGGDSDTELWLWKAIGYTLTGHVAEDAFFFLRGPGGNGKSTLLKALAGVLGDYAHSLNIRFLTAGNDQGHSTEFAALRGKRLLVLSEVEKGQRLALSRLKDLTGGEVSAPRDLHQKATDAQAFPPTAKPWCFGNYDLAISGNDGGTWRRIHRIESEHVFPKTNVRDGLVAAEGEGILRFAVDAAREWYETGLGDPPERIAKATHAYRVAQDLTGKFFRECLVFAEPGEKDCHIAKTTFQSLYRAWCEDEGVEHRGGPKDMAARLAERGVTEKQVGNARTRSWVGARARTADDDAKDAKAEADAKAQAQA